MLKYIEASTERNVVSPELESIHNLVTAVKQNKKVGVRYMLAIEHDLEMKEEGRREGIEQGLEKGEENFARLVDVLTKENRLDEIILCANDKERRKALMKELNII